MKSQKWDSNNIKDQSGKVAIVTGSSSGIGYEAARVLAKKNAEVIIAVRNQAKGDKAVQKIKDQNQNADVKVMILDLASLKSVKSFTDEFNQKYKRLDYLINNAGVMIPPYSKTEDGFELQFGTNHLGHFALTAQLFDLLKNTENSRIVNVSSTAHKFGKINLSDLAWEKRKYKPWTAYGDSKIANLYVTYELKSRLSQSSSKQGTLPTLRAAFDENASNGDFFGPDGFIDMKGYPVKVESNKLSHDKEIAKKLWDVSEELTNITFNLN